MQPATVRCTRCFCTAGADLDRRVARQRDQVRLGAVLDAFYRLRCQSRLGVAEPGAERAPLPAPGGCHAAVPAMPSAITVERWRLSGTVRTG
jgi:hypothetical protein